MAPHTLAIHTLTMAIKWYHTLNQWLSCTHIYIDEAGMHTSTKVINAYHTLNQSLKYIHR